MRAIVESLMKALRIQTWFMYLGFILKVPSRKAQSISGLLRDSRHATLMKAITRLPLGVLQSL